MPITVGHDTSNTRKTLSAGGASVDFYSIPAAETAGLGAFSKLPAALKVVLRVWREVRWRGPASTKPTLKAASAAVRADSDCPRADSRIDLSASEVARCFLITWYPKGESPSRAIATMMRVIRSRRLECGLSRTLI